MHDCTQAPNRYPKRYSALKYRWPFSRWTLRRSNLQAIFAYKRWVIFYCTPSYFPPSFFGGLKSAVYVRSFMKNMNGFRTPSLRTYIWLSSRMEKWCREKKTAPAATNKGYINAVRVYVGCVFFFLKGITAVAATTTLVFRRLYVPVFFSPRGRVLFLTRTKKITIINIIYENVNIFWFF